MRQILFGEQWIHPEAPPLVKEIFYAKGRRVNLKKGSELLHGAPSGEVTLLLSGICLYRFWDSLDKEHIMSIMPPGRTVGDIDALCGNHRQRQRLYGKRRYRPRASVSRLARIYHC